MPVSSIPANLLTHLNVAFAYIGADYQMTSMSGVAADIYSRQVAIRLSIQSYVMKFLHDLCFLYHKNNRQYD